MSQNPGSNREKQHTQNNARVLLKSYVKSLSHKHKHRYTTLRQPRRALQNLRNKAYNGTSPPRFVFGPHFTCGLEYPRLGPP
jgi:hypothetical protein